MAPVPASVVRQAELLDANGKKYFEKRRFLAAVDAHTEVDSSFFLLFSSCSPFFTCIGLWWSFLDFHVVSGSVGFPVGFRLIFESNGVGTLGYVTKSPNFIAGFGPPVTLWYISFSLRDFLGMVRLGFLLAFVWSLSRMVSIPYGLHQRSTDFLVGFGPRVTRWYISLALYDFLGMGSIMTQGFTLSSKLHYTFHFVPLTLFSLGLRFNIRFNFSPFVTLAQFIIYFLSSWFVFVLGDLNFAGNYSLPGRGIILGKPSNLLYEAEVRTADSSSPLLFFCFFRFGSSPLSPLFWFVLLIEFCSQWTKVEADSRKALELDSRSTKVSSSPCSHIQYCYICLPTISPFLPSMWCSDSGICYLSSHCIISKDTVVSEQTLT